MSEKKKAEAISGWYPKSIGAPRELTEEEAKKEDEWFNRLIKGNYKRLSAEIPGKMMLALGKMALEKGTPFTTLIEEILGEYLEKQGIDWKKA
jgi:hypothetical protein